MPVIRKAFGHLTDGRSVGSILLLDPTTPRSSLGMRIRTNQRGLQFYSGNQLDQAEPVAFPVKSAFCLEPHGYPNAINKPRFPDITLRSGHEYVHETSYELYRSKPTICRESTDA
jgi:galactose mutarotase-like enzyme